jgi:hypothetical protein
MYRLPEGTLIFIAFSAAEKFPREESSVASCRIASVPTSLQAGDPEAEVGIPGEFG